MQKGEPMGLDPILEQFPVALQKRRAIGVHGQIETRPERFVFPGPFVIADDVIDLFPPVGYGGT